MTLPQTLSKVASLIRQSKTCLVASHEGPDGDTLGSALALGYALRKLKKKVSFYCASPVPRNLSFLPGTRLFSSELRSRPPYDLSFMLDVGERHRVSSDFETSSNLGCVICVDHHVVGNHDGDINLVMPKASATGIVVYHLIKKLGLKKLGKDIATQLYCAISTDTGSFRYSNTNLETFRICEELMQEGVDPWLVAKNCFETVSRGRLELLKRVLDTLWVHPSGQLASFIVTLEDMAAAKASMDEAESFIGLARALEGVEVAVSFKEAAPGDYRISFRSNFKVDVSKIAQEFGGGGHRHAAGCALIGRLPEIQEKIYAAILKRLS